MPDDATYVYATLTKCVRIEIIGVQTIGSASVAWLHEMSGSLRLQIAQRRRWDEVGYTYELNAL